MYMVSNMQEQRPEVSLIRTDGRSSRQWDAKTAVDSAKPLLSCEYLTFFDNYDSTKSTMMR